MLSWRDSLPFNRKLVPSSIFWISSPFAFPGDLCHQLTSFLYLQAILLYCNFFSAFKHIIVSYVQTNKWRPLGSLSPLSYWTISLLPLNTNFFNCLHSCLHFFTSTHSNLSSSPHDSTEIALNKVTATPMLLNSPFLATQQYSSQIIAFFLDVPSFIGLWKSHSPSFPFISLTILSPSPFVASSCNVLMFVVMSQSSSLLILLSP